MEEDDVVKAPLTRLRRRLSVESEVGSPSAPSTPTKKRLAAKPQLGNIDEHAAVEKVGKRRTSAARSIIDTPEERPMTPARRNTRINSNTSITSEVVQSFDSPRAKRAARRTSILGSDTEAPVTPVIKTRRTRKDSASSVENQEPVTKPATQLAKETISEEPEAPKTSATNSLSSDGISPNTRKSQRIAAKRKSNNLNKSDSESSASLNRSKVNEIKKDDSPKVTLTPKLSKTAIALLNFSQDIENNLKSNKSKDDSINESKQQTRKSKSLTNIPDPTPEVDTSEDIKHKTNANRSFNHRKLSNDVGAGDAFVFEAKIDTGDQSLLISDKENIDIVLNTSSSMKSDNTDKASNKRNSGGTPVGIDTVDTSANKANYSESMNFLQETKGGHIECKVYIEDSDSNTGSIGKNSNVQSNDADDQCVPVVEKLNKSKNLEKHDHIIEDQTANIEFDKEKSSLFASKTLNCSIEPMDIDETVPENISIINSPAAQKMAIIESDKSFKNAPSSNVENESKIVGNKSANLDKPLVSRSDRHLMTANENKSTLILSQLKDDSASDANVTKSPKKKDESLTNANVSKTKRNSISITEDSPKTPLKNKQLQKKGMQTSTPVIPTNNDMKAEKNNVKIANPKDSSNITTSNKVMEHSDESTDDSSDEEMYQGKSDLLNDEAEEAGDDYESGDSQDESQRRYEEENEIVAKGETLTSDEDISNDSDYEKDSFIVSSDEEDQDLLSGSGDDLSVGDNELNMTAKSKQKYNERKVKEQKKASREMYEARHGKKKSLPESSDDDETLKPVKKNSRQRIDSSLLASGDDSIIKPKKNNRMRLNSTNDTSCMKSDADKSISKKKSKKKQVFDDTITNEKEISLVANESILKKKDPLKTTMKTEPKTPQKDFDISTVHISTVMNVEEVQLNENASILKANETLDPLQTTMAHDDEDSDSSSGNEEIIQNYDSLLSNLTKETKQSKKELNTSLNLNKNTKEKSNPIIDQLNLTQTKNVEKSSKSTESQDKNASVKNANKRTINVSDDESTSDSIDLKMLLPDDSSESSDGKRKDVAESCYPGDEDFIPLKRTEGKTNLRDSTGSQKLDNSLTKIPASIKKKNKSVSESSNIELSFVGEKKDKNVSIAELTGETPENISLSQSPGSSKMKKKMSESSDVHTELSEEPNLDMSVGSKKKKSKRHSESSANDTAQAIEDLIILEDRTPASDKKNKKQRNSISLADQVPAEAAVNVSVTGSNKKKKKASDTSVADTNETGETPGNISLSKSPGSSKKKKKMSESSDVHTEFTEEPNLDMSVGSKKKKNKRHSESSANDTAQAIEDLIILEDRTPASDKKNKKQRNSISLADQVPAEAAVNVSVTGSNKKKKKASDTSVADTNETGETPGNISLSKSPGSSKKKKKMSESSDVHTEFTEEPNLDMSVGSKKKKCKRHSESSANDTAQAIEDLIILEDRTPASDKKNKKQRNSISLADQVPAEAAVNVSVTGSNNKKKKKASDSSVADTNETVTAIDDVAVVEESSKKRKRNSSVSEEIVLDSLLDNPHDLLLAAAGSRKKKKRKISDKEAEIIFKSESTEAGSLQNTKSQQRKKRKQRSDDKSEHAKSIKSAFLDNITVPRLPTNILDQLEEKPTNKEAVKKAKIVSTSAFEVVEARPRKNKPSQYLEDSIYLNSESPEKKKRKTNVEKPKVLPFVPTASTSSSGFTTTFKVNVNPRETTFIAQASGMPNFKKDYLHNKQMKKLGTFEMYKKQRSVKLCKF